jgi:hypothetical protein
VGSWRLLFAVLASVIVALAAACGSNESELPSNARVGPSGGTVEKAGVKIEVPPGAVDRDVTIEITADAPSPTGFRVNGSTYRFEPAGLEFAKDVAVTFPTGTSADTVFWTLPAASDRYDRVPTEIVGDRAVAQVRHFSNGFVGATQGVTCTTKRRIQDTATSCSQSTTTETDVHLWLVAQGADVEGALATDSRGIRDLYANPPPNAGLFITKDATHTIYEGYEGMGVAQRSGSVVAFTLDGKRFGAPAPGCETVPLVEVSCSGTVELGAPTSIEDAGTIGPVADAQAVDAAFDADASQGITCTTKRRVQVTTTSCSQNTTIEPNVRLWIVPKTSAPIDAEGGMATSSAGIREFYMAPSNDADYAIFFTKDATHTVYEAFEGTGTAYRSGSAVSLTVNAVRFGSPPPGCETVPLIDVKCSGATTLGK